MRQVIAIMLILFILLASFRVENTNAGTIEVDINGGGDYIRIQDAIDAASNGDTIFIRAGIYHEKIVVDKSIKLIGESRDAVIIDGGGSGNIINVKVGSIIESITIRNSSNGAGIFLDGVHGMDIYDCKIYNVYYGIELSSSSNVRIEDSIISNTINIGIIIDSYSHDNLIFHNSFLNNGINAFDKGYDNAWYNETLHEGNYWDDYNGIDANGDGIGDTPYPIEPAIDINKDMYPLMKNYTQLSILHLIAQPIIQIPNKNVNISCRIVSENKIISAFVNITFPSGEHINESLNQIGNTSYYYFNRSYSLKGIYYYYIWAKDSNNKSVKTALHKFVIAYKPIAAFSYTPMQLTDMDVVKFNSTSYDSDGYITNYTWNIYDVSFKRTLAIFYASNFSYKFPDNGEYEVSLTVTDNDGAWDTVTKSISVANIPPTANLSWRLLPPYYSKPYVGQHIKFECNGYDPDGEIRIYEWKFGDGNSITTSNNYTIYSYSKNGVFNVTLTAIDNDYGTTSITKSIAIYDIFPPSIKNLTAYPNPQEAGSSVNISCNIDDDVGVEYAWLIVATPNGSINVTMHSNGDKYFYNFVFSNPGNYSYHIITSDINGNKNESAAHYFNIIIPPSPPSITGVAISPGWQVEYGSDANISCYVVDNVGVGSVVINLNGNKSMNGITDAKGNGIYYYTFHPSIGNYTFKIYATDINGYTNSTPYFNFSVADTLPPKIENLSYKNIVNLNQPQNISCIIYDPSGVKGARINITKPDGYINESMDKNSNYYYNFSCNLTGEYTFYIWVVDNIGNSGRSSIYHFNVTANIPPVANFTWQPLQPYANEIIIFNASLSYDSDGVIINYTWQFGDGSIGYGSIVNHSYNIKGKYNVTLIVTDDDGGIARITKTIEIGINFPPSITIISPSNGSVVSGAITIEGNASDDNGVVSVEIRIDNGSWIMVEGINHWEYELNTSYLSNGLHFIEARAYDGFLYSYFNISVNIENIDFIYSGNVSGVPINFSVIGDVNANYTWQFGDGSIAYGSIVSHIYPIGNYYNVTLIARFGNKSIKLNKIIRIDTLVTLVKNSNNVVNFVSWSASYPIKASQLASLIGEPMQKGSVISKWNTSKGSYDDYIVGVSPSNYDFVISPGDAIVLRVASPGNFVIPASSIHNRSVELVKNSNNVVNFISWLSLSKIKASQLASLIGEPMQKGSVISKWNTSKGSYDDYIVGVSPSNYDFVISPGDAIVLRVASPGNFVIPEVIK